MRWFSLAHKATPHFFNFLQFRPYGGSNFGSANRFFRASDSMGRSKAMELPSYSYQIQSLNICHRFSTSTMSESPHRMLNGTQNNNDKNDMKKVDLKIITRETIKPVSPTPHHLRNFNLSIIDQICYDYYFPVILFIPNSSKASATDVMSKRSIHLKKTLSHILSQFYPLAGEVKDMLHIECNDKGVLYTEAGINQTLEEFLRRPDDEMVKELMPQSPRIAESAIGNYILGIQVNIFSCGGIGLSTSMTHKIMDFYTYMVFIKAWAAAARGSPETISPSFCANEVFPKDHCLEYTLPNELRTSDLLLTKRFVFDSTSLTLLKAQLVDNTSPPSKRPTRMEATTSIIWKAAAKAASTVRPFSPQSPHVLTSIVNLRKRASPPFPENSIGNIVMTAGAVCLPESQPNLPTLLGKIRESVATVNSDYIESLKGEKGHEIVKETMKGLKYLFMNNVIKVEDCIIASSILNSGVYDLDFGWGKPIWFYLVNPDLMNFVVLNDTLKGGGVEAIVTLRPDQMEIFERDHELLSYVTVNPSPLRYLNH